VIWTTWCPTCKLEIPHLKELRKTFDQEKLAILSISNEPPALLKEFAEKESINYTVLSGSQLPAPFGEVKYIPSGFYIDPEGKFKLAATGLVPTGDAEAIIQAK
jgi:peroxiredoxin